MVEVGAAVAADDLGNQPDAVERLANRRGDGGVGGQVGIAQPVVADHPPLVGIGDGVDIVVQGGGVDVQDIPEVAVVLVKIDPGLLELADLVKFAKWNPLPDENERNEQLAYDFVLKTKRVVSLRKEDPDIATDIREERNTEKEVGDAE